MTRKTSTGELLVRYVEANVRQIEELDPLVRCAAPDAVHKMRVASRRGRSALATYRPVLDRDRTDRLRDELKWLAAALGEARDIEVVLERLDVLVREQPAELVLGPVARRVHIGLGARSRAGSAAALEALESARYYRMLDDLERFVAAPPLNLAADRRASRQVPVLLKRELKRLSKRERAVAAAVDRERRQLALHDVRKAAKRLRYAAESAYGVLGDGASKLAGRAAAVQDVLGSYRDSVLARDALRALGVQAHLNGENGFTFGRLHALEETRAARLDQEFLRLAAGLPSSAALDRWLGKQ